MIAHGPDGFIGGDAIGDQHPVHPGGGGSPDIGRGDAYYKAVFRKYIQKAGSFQKNIRIGLAPLHHVTAYHGIKIMQQACVFQVGNGFIAAGGGCHSHGITFGFQCVQGFFDTGQQEIGALGNERLRNFQTNFVKAFIIEFRAQGILENLDGFRPVT